MIAQRNPKINIHAVEIDASACIDAQLNFSTSQWSGRFELFCDDLKNFNPKIKYDLIVSNPPFFTNSLKSINEQQNIARHDHVLSPEDIFKYSSDNLSENGSLNLIYPNDRLEELKETANKYQLFLNACTFVKPTPTKEAHRVLLEFTKQKSDSVLLDEIIIEENGRHKYSEKYKLLTQDFYLNF